MLNNVADFIFHIWFCCFAPDHLVYLPQGVWKDGVDGSMRKGSRWIHNYRVPEDKIAYFVKMPDDTRF